MLEESDQVGCLVDYCGVALETREDMRIPWLAWAGNEAKILLSETSAARRL
jgi:hypothetical protein